jgi:hypothetical protein
METEIAALVTKYLQELQEDNAAVFIGAGFSKAAGYVDWVGLLAPIAAELGLDARKESVELVKIAQFHINAHAGNKHELNERLINEFSDLHDPTENHAILARLPIQTYWTTNCDRLFEWVTNFIRPRHRSRHRQGAQKWEQLAEAPIDVPDQFVDLLGL